MNGKWTKQNFERFNNEHPEIYNMFEKFTLQATQHRSRYSAKSIFHRIRWETMVGGDDDYKIDDGWISHYARLFLDKHPQHFGFFETRVRKNSYHNELDIGHRDRQQA